MGSVSRSCCRTPCIRGGSSVVQRNVRQAIPRLCLWNPQPQEMKQTTLASGMAFDSLDWSLFFCILYEFNDGIWLEKQADRKSTRLNCSHSSISYAVFCLKKKKNTN